MGHHAETVVFEEGMGVVIADARFEIDRIDAATGQPFPSPAEQNASEPFAPQIAADDQIADHAEGTVAVGGDLRHDESPDRAVGLGDGALIWRYLALNCWPTILIYMTLQLGQAILLGAALSWAWAPSRRPPNWAAWPPTAASSCRSRRRFRPCPARPSFSWFWHSTCWATPCATLSIRSCGNEMRQEEVWA